MVYLGRQPGQQIQVFQTDLRHLARTAPTILFDALKHTGYRNGQLAFKTELESSRVSTYS